MWIQEILDYCVSGRGNWNKFFVLVMVWVDSEYRRRLLQLLRAISQAENVRHCRWDHASYYKMDGEGERKISAKSQYARKNDRVRRYPS